MEKMISAPVVTQQKEAKVTEAELGWLAGILDGEGSVILFLGVRKGGKLNNVSPQVIVGNTDFVLLDKYVDILRRLNVGVNVTTRRSSNKTGVEGSKPSHKSYKPLKAASTVGFLRVKALLDVVNSYLVGEKRHKAELILQLINRRLSRCVRNGKYSNTAYDKGDLELIWEICQTMKSKHAHVVESLLKNYGQEQRTKNALKRPSEKKRTGRAVSGSHLSSAPPCGRSAQGSATTGIERGAAESPDDAFPLPLHSLCF